MPRVLNWISPHIYLSLAGSWVQADRTENEGTNPQLKSGTSLLSCHLTLDYASAQRFLTASNSCSTHVDVSAPSPNSFQLLVASNGTAYTSSILNLGGGKPGFPGEHFLEDVLRTHNRHPASCSTFRAEVCTFPLPHLTR